MLLFVALLIVSVRRFFWSDSRMYRIEYIPSVHAVPLFVTVPEHSRCESPKIYRFMVEPHASRTPIPSCDENKQTLRFEAEQIKMFFDFFPLCVCGGFFWSDITMLRLWYISMCNFD